MPLPSDITKLIGQRLTAAFENQPNAFINNADRAGEVRLLMRTRGIIRVIEGVSKEVDPKYKDQVSKSVDGLRAWCGAQQAWLEAHPEPAARRAYERIPPELY